MNKNRKEKGFTLIEILIVIGIIALLATIVIIAINPARQFAQARDTKRVSNVNAILNAIGQYAADNKGDILVLGIPQAPAVPGEISDAGVDLCNDLVPTYLPSLPIDPKTGVEGADTDGDDQVSLDECDDGYNTKYTVQQGDVASGERISVCAIGDITVDICVTR